MTLVAAMHFTCRPRCGVALFEAVASIITQLAQRKASFLQIIGDVLVREAEVLVGVANELPTLLKRNTRNGNDNLWYESVARKRIEGEGVEPMW